jgi:hypothetical protein
MGLHLGWIPNEPGLRPREFERPAPAEPAPDPAKVAALAAAQHARALWTRMLIAVGLIAFALFGFVAAVARIRWAWWVAGGLALACLAPVALLGLNRRRAAARLRAETESRARQHATELAEYEQGRSQWARSEAERIAVAPRWLQVAAHEDIARLDVFGGTGLGRQNMVTGLGWELLGQRAVIVLDLSHDMVADGLVAAALRAGLSCQDYQLPRDLARTPLLAGLAGEEIASLIVEVVHADDAGATAAGRATDLMILKKITGVLGADVSMARLHTALTALLGDAPGDAPPPDGGQATGGRLTEGERASLGALFGDGFRHQVAGNLVRLAAVVEPLTALGANAGSRPPARLTCLSLSDGPRDVAADLTAALVVQWVTRAVSAAGDTGDGTGGSPVRPAVILAGADEQSARHLGRLTAVCERYDVPLVRAFSRLTEESARHLDTRHTAFMRLATRPEAIRAAEHIGLERRFVAGRFAHRHSVSRLRTRTTSDSVTHTSGRTEGGATTHTVGTTKGQAESETAIPRHEPQVNVRIEDHHPQPGQRGGERDRGGTGRTEPSRGQGGHGGEGGQGSQGGAGKGSGAGNGGWGSGGNGGGGRSGGNGGGGNGGGRRVTSVQVGGKGGKPAFDIVKTRTRFSARHESDATTKSWSTTEETSHTTSTSQARTDGVSVGDEISYELVYDHRVQPETLMALPEDQLLAPHVTEAPARASEALTGGGARQQADGKLVALVIDPAVVGSGPVAPVRAGEIPAYEPPVPAVSAQVPDYARVPRPAIDAGEQELRKTATARHRSA